MCNGVNFFVAGRCPICPESDVLSRVEAYHCNGRYSLFKPDRCVFDLVKEYAVINQDRWGRDPGTSDLPCIGCAAIRVEPELDEHLIQSFLQRCRFIGSYYFSSSREENYPPSSHATRSGYSSQMSGSTADTMEAASILTSMSTDAQSTALTASNASRLSSEGSSDRSVDILADDEEFQAQRDERERIGDRWRRQDHRQLVNARRGHRSEGRRNDRQQGSQSSPHGRERPRRSPEAERTASSRDREAERRRPLGR